MPRPGIVLLALAVLCPGETTSDVEQKLLRLAEEAEIFAMLAPKVIGQEALEQVAAQDSPRFQRRGAKPEIPYQTRHITSEYGFSTFRDDPKNLHELRQVLTVDGRKVKAPGKLRETLSMGLKEDVDKTKKRMLKEFEGYGLREAATDFGQIILLFSKRQQVNYVFRPLRMGFIGADKALVLSYEQKDGETAVTVFEGKHVVRHRLKGELWLRANDGLPMRITMDAGRLEKTVPLRHYAVVDYQLSSHGVVLPAAVTYAESVGGTVMVENRFRYTDFKMFGASSELKFTVEESPVPPSIQK